MFPSAAQLRRILSPVVADATNALGSRVTVKRRETTYGADNDAVIAWADQATNIACRISVVAGGRVARMWGESSTVSAEGTVMDTTDVQVGDAIVVTSGFFAGSQYMVEQTKPTPLSGSILLGLSLPEEPIE